MSQQPYHQQPPQPDPYAYASTPPPPPPKQGLSNTSTTHSADRASTPAPQWTQHSQYTSTDAQYQPGEQQQQQHPPHAQPTIPPPEEGWLPEILLDKSKPDLQSLLQDPTLLSALLHSPATAHPAYTASLAPLHEALSSNAALASHLSSQGAHLQQTRSHTATRLGSVRALEQAFKKKQGDLDARVEEYGPRALHSRLVASIGEQEGVCRGIEESVIEGDAGERLSEREVAEWMRRVREARKVLWLRKERRERWDEGRVGGWR